MINFFKIFFIMIFLHILADYNLQGILANMKQIDWWKSKSNEDLDQSIHKNDYIIALFMHSFCWSFMIGLPFLFYKSDLFFIYSTIINTNCHMIIDNEKANKHSINLVQDQLLHIGQIIITLIIYFLLY